jgi:hypothetical protein
VGRLVHIAEQHRLSPEPLLRTPLRELIPSAYELVLVALLHDPCRRRAMAEG